MIGSEGQRTHLNSLLSSSVSMKSSVSILAPSEQVWVRVRIRVQLGTESRGSVTASFTVREGLVGCDEDSKG